MPLTAAGGSGEQERPRLKERLRRAAHAAAEPVVRGLTALHVRPDHLTALGCLLSLIAALAFFEGAFRWGAALVAASGICDILDGELARRGGQSTRFGAFLDSTLDRLGEAAILTGIAGFYLFNLLELAYDPGRVILDLQRGLEPRTWAVVSLTAMVALVGSFLVSYTRARAEGLGVECRVGLMERTERMVLLIVAGAFGVGPVMPGILLLLAALSFVTAAQRMAFMWKSTRDR